MEIGHKLPHTRIPFLGCVTLPQNHRFIADENPIFKADFQKKQKKIISNNTNIPILRWHFGGGWRFPEFAHLKGIFRKKEKRKFKRKMNIPILVCDFGVGWRSRNLQIWRAFSEKNKTLKFKRDMHIPILGCDFRCVTFTQKPQFSMGFWAKKNK